MPRLNMTQSFYHDDIYTSIAMGVTITIPPNLLSTQIQTPMSPVLSGTGAHMTRHDHSTQHQQMERPKDQRLLHLCATGELFLPDNEEDGHTRGHLYCFSISFSPLTTNITRALPLEAIKGEAEATSRGWDQID
jgi:hypothetical protein